MKDEKEHDEKMCSKCKRTLKLHWFYKQWKNNRHILRADCKMCNSDYYKQYNEKRRNKINHEKLINAKCVSNNTSPKAST